MRLRLQSFLSKAGVSSRRAAEGLISAGRVRVNGAVMPRKGFGVDTDKDVISLDGKRLSFSAKEYYIVNKPKGYISTVKDPHAEKRVVDLVPDKRLRLYPVGRLDKDTTGVLLLTNDGDLAYRLTHPSFEVEKLYSVRAKGCLSDPGLKSLKAGIDLDGKLTAPCRVRSLALKKTETSLVLEMHEGRKRQIRRMFEAIGHPVIELQRVGFAGLRLGALKCGESRKLTEAEVKRLKGLFRRP
ncbi:pseudouridine synthase [Candidatus Omnitrophota bacterium]